MQANSGAWASWAYVWALIPGAAGLGMAAYGVLTRTTDLVDKGVRLVVIAGVMYLVGAWYFGAIFSTGEQPIDVATWWPVALIVVGAIIALRALFKTRHGPTETSEPAGGPAR